MICHVRNYLRTLTYKAHGVWLTPKITRIVDNNALKVQIGPQVYHLHRQNNFKNADSGTTPQILAQEVLAHYQAVPNIETIIDEFGNIVLTPNSAYFEQIAHQIVDKKKLKIKVPKGWKTKQIRGLYFDKVPDDPYSNIRITWMENVALDICKNIFDQSKTQSLSKPDQKLIMEGFCLRNRKLALQKIYNSWERIHLFGIVHQRSINTLIFQQLRTTTNIEPIIAQYIVSSPPLKFVGINRCIAGVYDALDKFQLLQAHSLTCTEMAPFSIVLAQLLRSIGYNYNWVQSLIPMIQKD